ncbi:MAG: SDR family NAD(P)-dependent oxidoreductase, partial [Clostridiales bacterium]|nr:SDR family NAD(P)-dependent oxidoreductase [Clostridiales bacterium]
ASPERRTVPDLFRLVKAADLQKLQWLHVYDDVPGALLQSGSVEGIDMLEGFSGFIKTLAREHLNVNIRMVNSFDPIDPASFPVTAMGELGVAEKFVEFVYENFERKRYLPVLCDIDESAPLSFELDEDSNVLVLGGAQGITKELIAKLAAECPCRYILVGRSQENEEEARRYWDLNSIDEIRSRLISEGELKNPREIEKRASAIHKTAQIAKAKKQLGEDIGAKVCYYAADVSDEDEFVRLIDDVRAKYGKIDAVFHAVGVLEDKLFTVKTLESFERTYYTKVTPLRVIARELLPDLKLLVMFGSVAATFGNQGQIDYAAGNTVFDLAACLIKKNQEQTRVISFNWGPWSGTGMVSPGLEAEFKNRGLSMIHVEEGSGFFMDDVMYGGDLPVVLALAGDSGDLDLFIENALDMTTWRPTAVYMKGAII